MIESLLTQLVSIVFADTVARDQILEVECPSTHFHMTVQSEDI
jgi:hypothetical protein